MKRSRALLVLPLIFVVPFAAPAFAYDDITGENYCGRLINAEMARKLHSQTHAPGVAGLPSSDTVWVGHRAGQNGNYWEVGVGPRRPGVSPDGLWNWDQPVKGDSLQGWWPIRSLYNSTGGQDRKDRNRAWWAIDIGNNANYRGNQANGRTFGVIGAWHRDGGSGVPAPGGIGTPAWAPLGGNHSAWMGLRRHGDTAYMDPITRNAFNEDVLAFNGIGPAVSTGGNDKGFPGYGSQMDQLLYRDLDLSASAESSLTLTFSYRTNMSTGIGTVSSTRTGWFDKDPLSAPSGATNPQPNNFISSSDAGDLGAPRDSFMVYVGAPVNDAACVYSNGATAPVYDPQRRWFAEVVRANQGLYKEILSVAGDHSASTVGTTVTHAQLAPILAASGGRVRVVFRVKTNRGFDDEGSAYSSNAAGAAVVDDVAYRIGSGATQVLGDFESPTAIDNDTGVSALAVWKSTGKPPAIYEHVHAFATLVYEDLCGQPGAPYRMCNMNGVVISSGDHDHSEAAGGLIDGTTERETFTGLVSPTICLKTQGPNTPNGWDLTGEMAEATEDYYAVYEIYTGIFDPFTKGNLWRYGFQSYPGNAKPSSGSYPAWGQVHFFGCVIFNPEKQCLQDYEGGYQSSLVRTSNTNGIPDSIRIYLGKQQQCFRFAVSTGCSPTDGAYWDNVSFAIVDGTPVAASTDIWHWFQDTFPANESPGYPGVAALFDTTAALIKTGLNTAPNTSSVLRYDVPGDTVVVRAYGSNLRLDLVFRILPGPGNYQPMGDRSNGDLRAVPSNPATIDRANARQFWSSYLADNGEKGTPGGHPTATSGPLTGKRVWSPNVWNSARCDTAEVNLFPNQGVGASGGPWDPGAWMSSYHELDSRGGANRLGIARNRCFVRCASCYASDVVCNGVPSYVGTPGVPNPATGFDGSATTLEGTKILPDGILTAGSHVQYFFRREDLGTPGPISTVPDTNVVYPQIAEGSLDGHRWQHFSVLPDRWKDMAYGGAGPACMLYVDWNDRRGNERVWVSVADSIGATAASRYGAHNGWHARGDRDVNDPAGFVRAHGGQPGTTWDMYQVKASESLTTSAGTLGSRLAVRDPANPYQSSRQGPTPEMLAAYYKILFILTGDLNSGILGPIRNRSQNDVEIIRDFLVGATPEAPRGLFIGGDGFVESEDFSAGNHTVLLNDYLGLDLRNSFYQQYSGSGQMGLASVQLNPTSAIAPATRSYRLQNGCMYTNDVLSLSTNVSEAVAASYYENVGPNGPYISGVLKPATAERPWISLVDGWNIEHFFGGITPSIGRIAYVFEALNQVFGSICSPTGAPVVPLDVPNDGNGERYVNFMGLWNNPYSSGFATVHFGLARADRVEARVYDIGGRLVRTLADRRFGAGEHRLTWDGLDDARHRVPRGVYFTRLRYTESGFEEAKKLTVLR